VRHFLYENPLQLASLRKRPEGIPPAGDGSGDVAHGIPDNLSVPRSRQFLLSRGRPQETRNVQVSTEGSVALILEGVHCFEEGCLRGDHC